jgi:hypothetical protein
MSNPYTDELRDYDRLWQETPEPDAPLPDGTYATLLTDAEILRGKQDPGQLFLRLEFTTLEDERMVSILITLTSDDAKRMAFTKRTLRRMGFEASRLSDLPEVIGGWVGLPFEVAVSTKNGYRNVYVNRRLDPAMLPQRAPQAVSPPAGADVPLPDDLPF